MSSPANDANQQQESFNKISRLDAILFALAIEVSLLQLGIIEGSLKLRLSQEEITDNHAKRKLDKLTKDREIVRDVLRRQLLELAECGERSTLEQAVSCLDERQSFTICKRLQHEELMTKLEMTVKELETNRAQGSEELYKMDQKIAILRDKIKDDQINTKSRVCFVEKYLFAKAESLELQLQVKRKPLPSADHEKRIHYELVKLIDLQTKEREEAIEFWRNRYNDDLCDINERLANKREELKAKLAHRQELQKIFDSHAGEINAWLTFKQKRAERLAKEEHDRASATRIQAWWRGVMVRKAFGRYKHLKNIKKSPAKSKKK